MSMILFRNGISGLGVLLPDPSWGGTESSGIPSDVQILCYLQRDSVFEKRNLGIEANWPNWPDIGYNMTLYKTTTGDWKLRTPTGDMFLADSAITNRGYALTKDNAKQAMYYAYVPCNGKYYWVAVCRETVGGGTNTSVPCDPYCQEVEKERTMYLSETSTPGSIPIRTIEKTIVCNPPDREVTIPCDEDNIFGGSVPKSPAPLSGLRGLEWV